MNNQENPTAGKMPDMAAAILDKLTGMNAEFSFDFENLEVQLPAGNGPAANLRLNGTLRVKTKGQKNLA